ncbi:ParB/RepB/Spo0J family partition protein [Brachybacterium sp. UNK5269]|uniref:ParB/RepB/Spo0J family partition protein n=1 Tax=Brachybacterium sp. UNK5269 TaxID=3408576 RepID=UPI003BB15EB2
MFFSGEKVSTDDGRPERERPVARDLAAGMARAAAERRGRTTGNGASRGTASKATAERATSASTTGAGSATTAPGRKTNPKTSTAKAAEKQPTAETAATKPPAKKTNAKPAAAKPAAGKPAAAKPATTSRAPEAAAVPAADSGPVTDDSPVVDVEPVELTPAREAAPQDAPAAAETEPDAPQDAAAKDDPSPVLEPVVAEQSAPAEVAEPTVDAAPATSDAQPRGLVSVPGAEFAEIPIHEIRENPRNPRTMFDEDELDELAYSLREVGVLQPVVVRPIPVTDDGESFELVMGERRWRAARRAGLTSIPAIIRETSDDDLLRDALLENLHRTQLNPLEEANAYQQLLEDFGCTQDELGERIGRSRPQITNTLRLLRLPALVQRRLASGAISAGHARALLSLDDPRLMEELAQRIVTEGLSVRAVERLVSTGGGQPATRTVRRSTYDPHVVDLTSRLSNRLETQVRIDIGKRKGRITLEFTNLEDLERLVESMGLDVAVPASEEGPGA